MEQKLGARIVRYADDIVILCRGGTKRSMAALQGILGKMDHLLNGTKPRVVDATRRCLDFSDSRLVFGEAVAWASAMHMFSHPRNPYRRLRPESPG